MRYIGTATCELWAIFKAGNLICVTQFYNWLSNYNFGLETCSTNSSGSYCIWKVKQVMQLCHPIQHCPLNCDKWHCHFETHIVSPNSSTCTAIPLIIIAICVMGLKMAMSFVTIKWATWNWVTQLHHLLNFPNSKPTQICAASFKSKITVTQQIRKFDNLFKIVWHKLSCPLWYQLTVITVNYRLDWTRKDGQVLPGVHWGNIC